MTRDELDRLGDIPDPLADAEREAAATPPPPRQAELGASPTRTDARRRQLLGGLVAFVWLVVVAIALGARGDLGVGALRTLVQIGLPALGGAIVIAAALTSGTSGLGSRTGRLMFTFAAALITFPVAAMFGSGVLLDDRPGVLHGMFGCFMMVILIGGVPLASLAFAQRRSFPANAPWRSVLLAAGAGLFGAATLGTHCSTHCGVHMALGHALPAVVLAFAGGALLTRFTRV